MYTVKSCVMLQNVLCSIMSLCLPGHCFRHKISFGSVVASLKNI